MTLVNPQQHSGLFRTQLPVYVGDSVTRLVARLVKQERAIKGTVHVQRSATLLNDCVELVIKLRP